MCWTRKLGSLHCEFVSKSTQATYNMLRRPLRLFPFIWLSPAKIPRGSALAKILATSSVDPMLHLRSWTAVAPLSVGECPTQSYNELLSLSKLQDFSDAVVLYENEQIMEMLLKKTESVGYQQINEYVADSMLGLFLPVSSLTPRAGGVSIGIEPWELIRSVVPMPSVKLLKTR